MLEADTASTIVAMERAALDRWGNGDPSGFLEISDPDVVYFDPFVDRRVDGLAALTERYEGIRGQVHVDRYELVNPMVAVIGDAAVLTFNHVSWNMSRCTRWNCTEVYARRGATWRIISTHWSYTAAPNSGEGR